MSRGQDQERRKASETLEYLWTHPHDEPMKSYILGSATEEDTRRINRLRLLTRQENFLTPEDPR